MTERQGRGQRRQGNDDPVRDTGVVRTSRTAALDDGRDARLVVAGTSEVPCSLPGGGPSRIRRSDHPSPLVAVERTGASRIRRVAVRFVDGVDADKPSTYDTGGGHSYADHGAHTTEEQHMTRLVSGRSPSGRPSKVPGDRPSTKFTSDGSHVEAFKAATELLTRKNADLPKIRGSADTVAVDGAGLSYWRKAPASTSSLVRLDIAPVDDTTLRVNSMYPTDR
jgi:hypothetical protein